jgi:hypothetical protein
MRDVRIASVTASFAKVKDANTKKSVTNPPIFLLDETMARE